MAKVIIQAVGDRLRRCSALGLAFTSLTCGTALAQPATDRPVLDWTFDSNANGDMAGPSFKTQFPQPDFVPGVTGQAWRSDGFSSSVFAPLRLSPDHGFTVQAWVALESYPAGYEKPVDEQIPGSLIQQAGKDAGFDIFVDAYGRWGVRISTASGTLRITAREPFPLYKWANVAATFDPATGAARLYLDGAPVGEKSGKPSSWKPAASDFRIAASWRGAPLGVFNINGINAAYDDVRVFDRAHEAAEIAAATKNVAPPDAQESLIVPTTRFAADLQRPVYHGMPPANWTNEPHGLVLRGSTWHLFYQRTPNGPYKTMMTWGHLRSEDLVHWTSLPIALRPELQKDDFGFDMKGIWSGDVVTGPGGFAYAFYTSVNHSATFYNPGISLAISDDPGLLNWKKVGPLVDRTGVDDFRDPYVWFEKGETRMIVGAALGGSGGLAYYRCANLASRSCWKRQPDFAPFRQMDIGSEIWEMPVFAAIGGGKYILEVNPIGGKVSKYGDPSTRGVYWIGTWDGATFRPDSLQAKMLDLLPGHLSPTVARDASGQLVGIGIVDERRTPEAQLRAGWAHTFGLPRVWRLLSDGKTLGQSPLPALTKLRLPDGAIQRRIEGVGQLPVGDLGQAVEITARFDPPLAQGTYGLDIATSPDGSETTRLYYDAERKEMVLDKQHSTLGKDGEGPQLLRGAYDEAAFGRPRDFRVFIDHSVVEVFVNDAAAFSFRIYPTRADSTRFAIRSSSRVGAEVQAWRLAAAPIR
ncbi:GH32 C-terminal domain-containing protein [Sphingomonas sp. NIBR02145]|uniref:GH32 C-terminal domain-containing protein n=1 Tax=Sphingomonas sp. NIBR02145 TaxID=3014784 RepID=UPI0022B4CE9A|nr:GH32 C-terminal domain-containing protein [Sphingomonas sp. NIBR02145]WHU04289.1 GH32 C-terminal domain-containing protein [Sphingomonas sp. NIBR02145]